MRNNIERLGQIQADRDVGLDKAESSMIHQIGYVVQASGRQIIYTNNNVASPDERITQV